MSDTESQSSNDASSSDASDSSYYSSDVESSDESDNLSDHENTDDKPTLRTPKKIAYTGAKDEPSKLTICAIHLYLLKIKSYHSIYNELMHVYKQYPLIFDTIIKDDLCDECRNFYTYFEYALNILSMRQVIHVIDFYAKMIPESIILNENTVHVSYLINKLWQQYPVALYEPDISPVQFLASSDIYDRVNRMEIFVQLCTGDTYISKIYHEENAFVKYIGECEFGSKYECKYVIKPRMFNEIVYVFSDMYTAIHDKKCSIEYYIIDTLLSRFISATGFDIIAYINNGSIYNVNVRILMLAASKYGYRTDLGNMMKTYIYTTKQFRVDVVKEILDSSDDLSNIKSSVYNTIWDLLCNYKHKVRNTSDMITLSSLLYDPESEYDENGNKKEVSLSA